jgi:hypothetical protein
MPARRPTRSILITLANNLYYILPIIPKNYAACHQNYRNIEEKKGGKPQLACLSFR